MAASYGNPGTKHLSVVPGDFSLTGKFFIFTNWSAVVTCLPDTKLINNGEACEK